MVAILNDQHENLTYIQSSALLTVQRHAFTPAAAQAGIELYDENHQVLRLFPVVGAKNTRLHHRPFFTPLFATFCIRNGLSNRDSGATMEHAHYIVPGVFL